MNKKPNPVLIGSFVLAGLILGLAGLVLFSGGRFLKKKFYCVAYFEESLSGLDVGAPVEYLGVRVGNVTDIRLMSFGTNDVLYRPVTIQIEPSRVSLSEGGAVQDFDLSTYNYLIQKGLRAKLSSGSLLTGKLKVELDFAPDTPAHLTTGPIDLPELPTLLSPIAAATAKLESMPFAEVVIDLRNLLKNLSDITGNREAQKLVPELSNTLQGVHELLAAIQKEMGPLRDNLNEMKDSGKRTMAELEETTQQLAELMGPLLQELTRASAGLSDTLDARSSIRINLDNLLKSLARASDSVSDLTDYLERHPEALLRGKGGSQ